MVDAGHAELSLPSEPLHPAFLEDAGLQAKDHTDLSPDDLAVVQQVDKSNLGQACCGLLSKGTHICPTTDGCVQVFGAEVRLLHTHACPNVLRLSTSSSMRCPFACLETSSLLLPLPSQAMPLERGRSPQGYVVAVKFTGPQQQA